MFFIRTPSTATRRDVFFLRTLPTVIVFMACAAITVISWLTVLRSNEAAQSKALIQKNTELANAFNRTLSNYGTILHGASGLFNSNGEVSASQWQSFVAAYQLPLHYTGVKAVGFARVVPSEQINDYTSAMQAETPSFHVYPATASNEHVVVTYVAPLSGSNPKAIGYDMSSDPKKVAAYTKAASKGMNVLTDPIALSLTDENQRKASGLILYRPVYTDGGTGSAPGTVKGYSYVVFQSVNLLSTIPGNLTDHYGFSVVSDNAKEPLVQSNNYTSLTSEPNTRPGTTPVDIYGTHWQIKGITSPAVVDYGLRDRPKIVLGSGLALSFFIASSIYSLLKYRTIALIKKEERIMQAAKDDLLALASHQLRTPATGVKQYVGLLLEGYMGELTTTQKKMLHKAYESNERQLSIINEMLFVARADAGHFNMTITRLNISQLVKAAAAEYKPLIKQKRQTLKLLLPRQPLLAEADKQYLFMAIENLISNAVKYTPERGTITIELLALSKQAKLRVTDTGVGVLHNKQHLLFKKFSRIPNDLTNKVSGSGIGLYLVKKVMQAHGGKVEFISTPNMGSTFVLYIPLESRVKKSATAKKNSR